MCVCVYIGRPDEEVYMWVCGDAGQKFLGDQNGVWKKLSHMALLGQ